MAKTSTQPTENKPETPAPIIEKKRKNGVDVTEPEQLPLIDRLKHYSPAEWERSLILYGWRVEPITDRKLTGNKNYIRKWSQPIDIDDVKHEFGSGVYKIQLNRMNDTTGHMTDIEGVQYFSILDEEFPPKIPMGEWVDDDRNRDWWWAKPKLLAKQNEALRNANAGSGNDISQIGQIVSDIIDKVRPEANDAEKQTLLTMVMQQMQANTKQMLELAKQSGDRGGGLDLKGLAELITAVKPPNPKSDDSMVTLLMTLYTEEKKDAREALQKLMERMERRNGGSRPDGPDWVGIARDVGGKLFDTLDSGFKVWLAVQAQKQSSGGRVAHPVITQPSSIPASPTQTPNVPSQPSMTPEDTLRAIDAQFGPMFDTVVPAMMEIFRDPDGVGMEFREVFLQRFGEFFYEQLQRLDVRTLTGVIEIHKSTSPPQIQRELADFGPPERVVKFITEFLSSTPWEEPSDNAREQPQGGF